jgi:hypothetical protein
MFDEKLRVFCGKNVSCQLGILHPTFLCVAIISTFSFAFYSLVFSPDMVGEFLYPLYVYYLF